MMLVRRKSIPIAEILLPVPNAKVIDLRAMDKRSGSDRRKNDRRRVFMEMPAGFVDRRCGIDRRSGYDRREFTSL
jgi:hypothetical protein